MKNATMNTANFVRDSVKFFAGGHLVKTCASVNEAKKHSRALQKTGQSVRRADSIGE